MFPLHSSMRCFKTCHVSLISKPSVPDMSLTWSAEYKWLVMITLVVLLGLTSDISNSVSTLPMESNFTIKWPSGSVCVLFMFLPPSLFLLPLSASVDMKQMLPLKLSARDDNTLKAKRSISPHQQLAHPPQPYSLHHQAGSSLQTYCLYILFVFPGQRLRKDKPKHSPLPSVIMLGSHRHQNDTQTFSTWANLTPPVHVPI